MNMSVPTLFEDLESQETSVNRALARMQTPASRRYLWAFSGSYPAIHIIHHSKASSVETTAYTPETPAGKTSSVPIPSGPE